MAEHIEEFQKDQPGYEGYLNDRVAALPEILNDAGYYTFMSGKWHLGLTPDRWPSKRGFQRSFSLLPGAANHYGWEPQLNEGDALPAILEKTRTFYVEDSRPIPVAELGSDFFSTKAFTDKLLEYLSERDDPDKPFLAYLPYSAPHWPLQAPEKDRLDYCGVYDRGPEVLRQQRLSRLKDLGIIAKDVVPHDVVTPPVDTFLSREWSTLSTEEKKFSSRTMEIYAAMVQNMDTHIGRVLDYLTNTDEIDNTFVIFMSDNGAEGLLFEAMPVVSNLFEHIKKYHNNHIDNLGNKDSYIWYGPHWASAATAPSRLYKAFSSEGGIRVPLILRYPPLTSTSSSSSSPTSSTSSNSTSNINTSFATVMDILPTILDLASIPHPYPTYNSKPIVPVRGKSWVPYLSHQTPHIHDADHVVGWELFDRQAIRKGKWKALRIPEPYGSGEWELFDLESDPGETRDLRGERGGKLEELLGEWEGYVRECGVKGRVPRYGVLKVGE
jgi:arylsulfatase A-like enzyme